MPESAAQADEPCLDLVGVPGSASERFRRPSAVTRSASRPPAVCGTRRREMTVAVALPSLGDVVAGGSVVVHIPELDRLTPSNDGAGGDALSPDGAVRGIRLVDAGCRVNAEGVDVRDALAPVTPLADVVRHGAVGV